MSASGKFTTPFKQCYNDKYKFVYERFCYTSIGPLKARY